MYDRVEKPENMVTSSFLLAMFCLFNITNPYAELILLSILGGLVLLHWIKQDAMDKWFFLSLLLISYVALITILNFNSISIYYFVSEFKIFFVFIVPYFFYFLFKNIDPAAVMLGFTKVLIGSMLVILLFGYFVAGQLRYTGFFDHSIYLSVALCLLFSHLYFALSIGWKSLLFLNVFLLGSSSGIFAFLLVVFFNSKKKIFIKVMFLCISMVFFYWYVVEFRGRVIVGGGIWEADRFLLLRAVLSYMGNHFAAENYLLGFGLGVELENFKFIYPMMTDQVSGFISYYKSFTPDGVYPYSFHNEFLRILFNYGLVGLLLFFTYLFRKLDKVTFIIIVWACFTNSILYSTVLILIISMIIASTSLMRQQVIEKASWSYSSLPRPEVLLLGGREDKERIYLRSYNEKKFNSEL